MLKINGNLYLRCFKRFSNKQHFYKQRQAEIGKKIKQKLSHTSRGWTFAI